MQPGAQFPILFSLPNFLRNLTRRWTPGIQQIQLSTCFPVCHSDRELGHHHVRALIYLTTEEVDFAHHRLFEFGRGRKLPWRIETPPRRSYLRVCLSAVRLHGMSLRNRMHSSSWVANSNKDIIITFHRWLRRSITYRNA